MSITDQIRLSMPEPRPICQPSIPSADTLREQGVRCETCPRFDLAKGFTEGIGHCDFHLDDRGTHNFCDEHPAFNKEGG